MPKRNRPKDEPAALPEIQSVQAATVAWMLATMTTLVCMVVAAIIWATKPEAPGVILFGQFLHFSACVTAIISLILVVVVLKMSRVRPPRGITIFAIVTAIVPLVAAVLRL